MRFGDGSALAIQAKEKANKFMIGKFGDKARRWKGENAGYVAKHMWITKHYGKASCCEFNTEHKNKRFEWANLSGRYLRDRSDYIQLCPSCHRKMDLSKPFCKHGHLYTPENTYLSPNGWRNCRVCLSESKKKWREKHAKAN